MDFSKFKPADWLQVGGAAVVLIAGFLNWFTFAGVDAGVNAFDFTFTGLVPWLVLVAAGVIAFLLATGVLKAGNTPWPVVLLGVTALGALLVLIRVLIGVDNWDRAIGLWLAAIGALVATAGAFLNFQAGGGNVRDLADLQKMRDAFKH